MKLSEFTGLLAPRVMSLGPGVPNGDMRAKLKSLTPESLFAGHTIHDMEMARTCLAGLWLYHDFLEESHEISQGIETATGSYWHGIMHRREPDDENAKYWFRRVGRHPVYDKLTAEAAKLGMGSAWDALKFVDLCSAARSGKGDASLCRETQMAEWRALFDYCRHEAL